ncbi:MAG: hypothetical protein JSU64_03685 [candidate division WOR-3 bacterium]|nr:MAG: hypothetical protein JSU64_03685 [candidate division WOR-3 bacterium]UCF06909.1 MAG: hypothetical protein JSV33_07790 [bacterium]
MPDEAMPSEGKWIGISQSIWPQKETGWLISFEWLLTQILKGMEDPEQKGLFICIKRTNGKVIDPKDEKIELCIRGKDDKSEVNMREEFPPIKWP